VGEAGTPVAVGPQRIAAVFFSNRHLDVRLDELKSDLQGAMTGMNARFGSIHARFDSMERLIQERLQHFEEIMDARLSRIEQELHLK